MEKLSFFSAVTYQDRPLSTWNSLLEKVDDYFYLGGRKAYVLKDPAKDGRERVMLGVAHSSTLFKIAKFASYFTLILPLLMLSAKLVLRSQHRFKLIDAQTKLSKGMEIDDKALLQLKTLMPQIQARKDDPKIQWLSQGNNLVFQLVDYPDFVFKIAQQGRSVMRGAEILNAKQISDSRFANMVKAKEICVTHQLGLLIIPQAKKIEIEVDKTQYTLIAEKKLSLAFDESQQEELYRANRKNLKKTASQLITFIAKARFNDVTWRNIPLLEEEASLEKQRRVVLVDLEHMNSARAGDGFLGDVTNGSRGLIRCLGKKLIDKVIAKAKKLNVSLPEMEVQHVKNRRLQELKEDKLLRALYTKNNIMTGKEPLQVNLEALGLDLNEQALITTYVEEKGIYRKEKQTITLGQVAKDVIAEINRLIQASSDEASIKGKRSLLLSVNREPISDYYRQNLGLPHGQYFVSEEEEKQLWLNRIIQALIDKGHLFKLNQVNGHGYFLQA